MKTIESLVPGSPAWLQSRSASKAPAMMGASKYQTRSDLLKQVATGMKEDVDANTQRLFDAGHASEATAREIAEDILCDGLSPVCGATDDDYLTASFDGLTFDGKIGFEHKLWNETLAAAVRAEELPEEYKIQMDQQILVGGLEYVLFMVSNGTREKCVSMEYRSTPERAAKLMAAWKQFDADIAAYQHVESVPEVTAAPQMALPALSIQVNGQISLIDNLEVFGRKLTDFIAGLPAKPATDQEFADADAAVKTLKTAEDALDAAESSALAQTASIDQMRRTVGLYRDQARTARLMLDKLVKARKESIRVEIMQAGANAFANHIGGLNKRLGMAMPPVAADFSGVMKGKKTVSSLRDAVDTELARAKIAANEVADKIQINLAILDAASHAFLFSDRAALVMKESEDLRLVVKVRIADHEAAEEKRIEAEREKIRVEEEAKAAAKIKAEQEEAERQRKANEAIESLAQINANNASASAALARTEPAAQPAPVASSTRLEETVVAAAPAANVVMGNAKLRDQIDDALRDLTGPELTKVIEAIASIRNSRKAAA
jgi:predicted phage-related endonuclease